MKPAEKTSYAGLPSSSGVTGSTLVRSRIASRNTPTWPATFRNGRSDINVEMFASHCSNSAPSLTICVMVRFSIENVFCAS